MNDKLVSCVIPTYKRSDSLERAIESVLNQTYKQFEILIVDDNEPNDEFSKVVKRKLEKYSSFSNVIYLSQGKHVNGASARNYGVLEAKGEYVAFLDDDDEWISTKLEKQIDFLKQNPQYDGCSCFYNEYRNGKLYHSVKPYTTENILFKIFSRDVAVCTPTVVLNKKCLIDAGLFDVTLKRHQDLQLLICFTNKYALGVCSEYLVKIHVDSNINRPNVQNLIEIKELFFKSVSEQYNTFSKTDQRVIRSAHIFEIIVAALKQREYRLLIIYLFKVPINCKAFNLLYKRIQNRKFITTEI